MKKIRLLYFLKEIPKEENNYDFIRSLRKFSELYSFYVESLFTEYGSLSLLKKYTDKTFNLRKIPQQINIDRLKKGRNILFFENQYLFKNYITQFKEVINENSILVFDIRNSIFLKFLDRFLNLKNQVYKNQMLKQIEILKERYLYIVHYFDLVIVNSKEEIKYLKSIFEKTYFLTTNEFLEMLKKKRFEISKAKKKLLKYIFNNLFEFKNVRECCPKDTEIFKVDERDLTVESYNKIFRETKKRYLLIYSKKDMFFNGLVRFFKFVSSFNKKNIMIVPSHFSNKSLNSKDFNLLFNFYKKHILSNLGNWREVKNIYHCSFFVDTTIFEKVGILDERFSSLYYSLMDYGYRIYQKGLKIIEVSEIFVNESIFRKLSKKANYYFMEDREFLIKKWGDLLPLDRL